MPVGPLTVRLGPPGTARDRINFFLRAQNEARWRLALTQPLPPGEGGASRPMFVRLGISGAKPPSGLLCQSRYKSAPIIVGGGMLKRPLSGQRWDYAGGYAGISGRKTGRFPLNPGYSRVFPRNEFQNFLRALRQGADAQFENKAPVQVVDYLSVTAVFRLISSFFTPFLSHKDLVSRRLGMKQGLIEFAEEIAEFESSKNAERIPIISCEGPSGPPSNLHPSGKAARRGVRTVTTGNIFLFFDINSGVQ